MNWIKQKPPLIATLTRLDLFWVLLTLGLLVPFLTKIQSGETCHQMGVDFRGYYASGKIALQHGFPSVYDQGLQMEVQSSLYYRCPVPPIQAPIFVGMPYLPLYVFLFLPFTLLDFTTGYFVWISFQLIIFLFYLNRLSRSLGQNTDVFRLLQWGIAIPLIANLYLGQINALLVMFFCEFLVAFTKGAKRTSGFWLSALLMKPHTLILIIPGLIISRRRKVFVGFCTGTLIIIFASLFVGGFQGFAGMIDLTNQFTGPLIQNVPGMINWRALALNLGTLLPTWTAYLVAVLGGLYTLWIIYPHWKNRHFTSKPALVTLMAATLFGTVTISWHSHFYMLMLLVPFLLYLDNEGVLSPKQRYIWLLGPPIIYISAYFLSPGLVSNILGVGLLTLSIFMLIELLKLLPTTAFTRKNAKVFPPK